MTSAKQFQKVLAEFAEGGVDILLGTQMVAKGLDFPKVSLVGVASADTSLAVPDFRASERTFQLIVQVAGRAGRGQTAGEVVVQTLHEQEPAIVFASRHDYDAFAAWELPLRKSAGLPPFCRLLRLIVRHPSIVQAEKDVLLLHQRIRPLLPAGVEAVPPQPAGVKKIRNRFRFQILLKSAQAGVVQQRVLESIATLTAGLRSEVAWDVDPINLL